MKIEFADNHGLPQFIVKSETSLDKEILSNFVNVQEKVDRSMRFHLHGYCYSDGNIISFNFGWSKPAKKSLFQKLKELCAVE